MTTAASHNRAAEITLDGVVVALDVDNTLCDPTGGAYDATVCAFLALVDLGLDASHCFDAYEAVRAAGGALERMGLTNPMHERGHPHGLAVLCLTQAANPALCRELGIDDDKQADHRTVLAELIQRNRAARTGSPESRFEAARTLLTFLEESEPLRRFRDRARSVADHPTIVDWSRAYEPTAARHPTEDPRPLVASLIERGAIPVAISQGQSAIQQAKLDRLGLTALDGRLLTTQAAADLPGVAELDAAITAALRSPDPDPSTAVLFLYRCVIDTWETKSPWFYGRCLHAIQNDRDKPQAALSRASFVPSETWKQHPLRFVMIGDRYDKDVAPVLELLGRERCLTGRLRLGKYKGLDPQDELPAAERPHHTFEDWSAMVYFLTESLTAESVSPIATPPAIADPTMLSPDQLERGLDSPFEAIRSIAALLAPSEPSRSTSG